MDENVITVLHHAPVPQAEVWRTEDQDLAGPYTHHSHHHIWSSRTLKYKYKVAYNYKTFIWQCKIILLLSPIGSDVRWRPVYTNGGRLGPVRITGFHTTYHSHLHGYRYSFHTTSFCLYIHSQITIKVPM